MSGVPSEPHTFVADLSTSCASAGVALMEKRSRALADYWRAIGVVRDPGEVLALNLGYCTELLDDYARALGEALAPAAVEPAQAPAPAAQEPAQAA